MFQVIDHPAREAIYKGPVPGAVGDEYLLELGLLARNCYPCPGHQLQGRPRLDAVTLGAHQLTEDVLREDANWMQRATVFRGGQAYPVA